MKYDFASIIDRKGKDALAVDNLPNGFGIVDEVHVRDGLDCIPMWIADMNFATVPTVTEALIERAKHPTYGYFNIRDEYYDSIIKWHRDRKGVTDLTKEEIGYENGVLGGVASALHVLCSQGDNILVHSSTYIGFTGVLNNNGYHIIHSPLQKDENGIWRMDFEDMEKKLLITRFTQLSSVLHTILPVVYGNAGKSKKLWRFMRNMMFMSLQMKSGLTLFLVTTSTFRHSQYPNMLKCIQLHFMHHPKHLTLQD